MHALRIFLKNCLACVWRQILFHELLVLEIVPFPQGIVLDGSTVYGDVDFVATPSTLYVSWIGFFDLKRGRIVHFEVALTTNPNPDAAPDVVPWTVVGLAAGYGFHNLSLAEGGKYYGLVRATDRVGHVSPVAVSNGQVVDNRCVCDCARLHGLCKGLGTGFCRHPPASVE
jgi:hypothetical protein